MFALGQSRRFRFIEAALVWSQPSAVPSRAAAPIDEMKSSHATIPPKARRSITCGSEDSRLGLSDGDVILFPSLIQ
jgi:hypothetical protein